MRYVNLSSILALRLIASKVNTRFPTYNSLVDAKLLLPSEVTFIFQIHCTFMTKYSLCNCIKYFKNVIFYNLKKERLERVDMKTPHESSWTPLLWAMKLLARAKADQKISIEPPSYTNLLASFEKVENVNRKLLRYSWINFPLAYTQVRYISTICIITHKNNLCFILLFFILY